MADKRSIDAMVAKLKSKVYVSNDELAADIAHGFSGIARNPSTQRGLKSGIITDVQGGTTLGVGDPGATNDSDGLVQNPQPGIATDVGSGLRTRRQARVETRTRTLPATVVTAAEAGDTTVRVRVAAEGVSKSQDALTQNETVGSVDMAAGTEYDAAMTGQPIVIEGGNGVQPIEEGRTVNVIMSENWEVITTFTSRGMRKNIPVVTRVLKSTSVALVNGFASVGTVCIPFSQISPQITISDGVNTGYALSEPGLYPFNLDWTILAGELLLPEYAGKPWGIAVVSADDSSGAIDMSSLGYYTYGVVPVDGEITFSVTMAYATANSKWAFTHTGGTVPYMYVLLIGCNQGQAVDYGTVTYVPADGGSGFNVLPENQWTITDSNFPIPL